MSDVALIILFNHKYERNLPKLRQIYAGRFSNLYFIMPFYKGRDQDVIAVYENSYYFHGYLAQAFNIIKNDRFQHYMVIGDDLILHPGINETNYQSYFRLHENTGFIPAIFQLDKNDRPLLRKSRLWHWNYHAVSFKTSKPGMEVASELPPVEDAINMISQHGINYNPYLSRKMLVGNKPYINKSGGLKTRLTDIVNWAVVNAKLSSKNNRKLGYPMVGSYSDIVVIPHSAIGTFAHYCGVFAALELFVEIAVPTALLLSVKKVSQEKDLENKGMTLWEADEFAEMESKYNADIQNLFNNFPPKTLYIHPIKLSKWKV